MPAATSPTAPSPTAPAASPGAVATLTGLQVDVAAGALTAVADAAAQQQRSADQDGPASSPTADAALAAAALTAAAAPSPSLVAPPGTSPVQANPVLAPPVAAQVAAQVSGRALAAAAEATRTGLHTITVQLHPAELGAIQVVATMGAAGLSLNLHAASDVTREVLRAALADLRADLAGSGLSQNASVQVSDQASYQAPQQDPGTAAQPGDDQQARGHGRRNESSTTAGRPGEHPAVADLTRPRLLNGLRRRVDLTL
jgi:flagellar hook-length control protein FliK